ncbi:HMA2 domain-containing protein [Peptostreptococcus sp. D1]|uniref:HMA2 domain-containing protein n=1 Tax=Peptostreptococcus sp. D1 TaxID=72304 RepID=UPI0008F2D401|nr:hypothetical protein [Peptostreptococcus sp. D1]SFE23639.1 hypothetical protein SAMN02910278_00369 [Peptostreptococcus sp. D1]
MLARRRFIFWGLLLASSVLTNSKDIKNISSIKKNINSLSIPSFKNVIEVRSAIAGRVRFYIPVLKSNHSLANNFITQIKQLPLIKKCEINTLTGSALFEYDEKNLDAQTLEGAVIKLLELDKLINGNKESSIEKEIRNISQAVNNGIYDYTNGKLNTKTLILIALVVGAFYQIRRNGCIIRPDYLTLLWWSRSILS